MAMVEAHGVGGGDARRVDEDGARRHPVVAVLLRAVELMVDVARGDRVDLELEVDRQHTRLGRGGGEGECRNGEGHGQRAEKYPQKRPFHSRKDSISEQGIPLRPRRACATLESGSVL